jgi:hypothetical protein
VYDSKKKKKKKTRNNFVKLLNFLLCVDTRIPKRMEPKRKVLLHDAHVHKGTLSFIISNFYCLKNDGKGAGVSSMCQ